MLDHELRLFRELETIKGNSKDSTSVLKALRFIDRKRKDAIDKKQLLVFLNSNVDDSHLKMTDINTIYRRLHLKQTGLINYIDFYNAVYGTLNFAERNDAVAIVKERKIKKKFLNLIDKEKEQITV